MAISKNPPVLPAAGTADAGVSGVKPAASGDLDGSGIFASLEQSFLTEPGSPFADKYSIAQEEAFLADYIAAGADDTDPLYDRYIELIDRKERFDKMQSAYKSDLGADTLVEHREAVGMLFMGKLVDEYDDTLTIHTYEGYRMFLGKRREPGKPRSMPIIGGKRTGSVLRSLWGMTERDNPFADWALVRHEQSMEELSARLDREIAAALALMKEKKEQGMDMSVLRNNEPGKIVLGFKSPYGFATVSYINRFDYFVRLQKTLERKDLRSSDQVRRTIAEITRLTRRVWNEVARFESWLNREQVRGISRRDFLPGADEEAGKRVAFLTQVLQNVPGPIFTCAIQPKHTRRHHHNTPQERALLKQVGEQLEQAEAQEAAGADAVEVGGVKPDAGTGGGAAGRGVLGQGQGAAGSAPGAGAV